MRARLPVRDEVKQPAGLIHGGVYASMAESMASMATRSRCCRGRAIGDGPVEQHELPAARSPTAMVHALATRLHRGRTTWVWDVRFSDDAGPHLRGHAHDDRRAPAAARPSSRPS